LVRVAGGGVGGGGRGPPVIHGERKAKTAGV